MKKRFSIPVEQYYLRQKKTEHGFLNSKNSRSFLKKLDNSKFDAQGRAETRKIGLETLRLAVFDQIRLFHQWVRVKLT